MHRRLLACLASILAIASMVAPAHRVAAATSGYITFERGKDGAPINISGMTLTTDSGENWLYGNTTTRAYNAPYPEDCTDRPGIVARPQCEYMLRGKGFAWIGLLGNEGRINFTRGTASFFSAEFSTGTPLTVAGYNPDGRLIQLATVPANSGTGELYLARLEAPVGEKLASVTISGAGGFWLMDTVTTDAPGVPNEQENERSTFVAVSQRVNNEADTIVSFTITARNEGRGNADNATIFLPFDSAKMQVLDAAFSQPSAWVSKLGSDSIELQTGPLNQKDIVTATVRLAVIGLPIIEIRDQLAYTWQDSNGINSGRSNRTIIRKTSGSTQATPERLDVGTTNGTFTFTSDLFIPGEPVALWYNGPNNSIVGVGRVTSSLNGTITVALPPEHRTSGYYSMVAYGLWTDLTAVGVFQIP